VLRDAPMLLVACILSLWLSQI